MIRSVPYGLLRTTVLGLTVAVLGLAAPGAAATTPAGDVGSVFVVHGLPGVTADVLIDGAVVEAAVEPAAIVGPFQLDPGEHTVTLRPTAGDSSDLSAMVPVEAGDSIDVVAHYASDPTAAPIITMYPNDLSPVAPDMSRLVVAHTAAVPPADIRVDGDVLFSNVANGEALTQLVPAGTYTVDIVPTGTAGPVVFGPVDLSVGAGELTRVFAFGNPDDDTMDAVVQTLPVPVDGSDAPSIVDTGTGGQAAALREHAAATGTVPPAVPITLATLLVAAALGVIRRRRSGPRPTTSS